MTGGLWLTFQLFANQIPGTFPHSLTAGHTGANAAFYGVGGVRMPSSYGEATRDLKAQNDPPSAGQGDWFPIAPSAMRWRTVRQPRYFSLVARSPWRSCGHRCDIFDCLYSSLLQKLPPAGGMGVRGVPLQVAFWHQNAMLAPSPPAAVRAVAPPLAGLFQAVK